MKTKNSTTTTALYNKLQLAEKRLDKQTGPPGHSTGRLLSFLQAPSYDMEEGMLELITDLNEAQSKLELEVINLRLTIHTLLREMGLSEDQVWRVLTHGYSDEKQR